MSEYSLSVDWDSAQTLVRLFLKDDIESLKNSISVYKSYEQEGVIKDFQKEDLKYEQEVYQALMKVYNYYTAEQDHIHE